MRSFAIWMALIFLSCAASQPDLSETQPTTHDWYAPVTFDKVERYPNGHPPPWRDDTLSYRIFLSTFPGRIDFSAPDSSSVTLFIFDESGDTVRTISDSTRSGPGWHFLQWSGVDQHGDTLDSDRFFYKVITVDSSFAGSTIFDRIR